MKNRFLILLLVVSLGINIGFLLRFFWVKNSSCVMPASRALPSGWHASPLRRDLGLSQEQVRLMEKERRSLLTQARPLQDELRQKRGELFMLLKGKNVSDADLDVVLNEISRLQIAIEKMFILHSLKMKGFFSPAQLHKYEEFFRQCLCPGMVPEVFCPPGKMSGRRSGHSGCANMQNIKK